MKSWMTAITITTDAPSAFVVHHLRPLITQSPPSSVARHARLVGSDPAVSGSVIEKHAVLAVGQAGAEIVARRQEQVPQALGLGPPAQLDQNPRQRGLAVDFAIERLLD